MEEKKNQAAVMGGPIVFCNEPRDVSDARVFDIVFSSAIEITPVQEELQGAQITFFEGRALLENEKE